MSIGTTYNYPTIPHKRLSPDVPEITSQISKKARIDDSSQIGENQNNVLNNTKQVTTGSLTTANSNSPLAARSSILNSTFTGTPLIPIPRRASTSQKSSAGSKTSTSFIPDKQELDTLKERVTKIETQISVISEKQNKTNRLLEDFLIRFAQISTPLQQASSSASTIQYLPLTELVTIASSELECVEENNYPAVIKCYNSVPHSAPEFGKVQYNLGRYYEGQKHYTKAINHYNNVPQLDLRFGKAQNNIAACYGKQNNYPEAIKHLKNVPQSAQEYEVVQYHLGVCYERQNNYLEAIKYYNKMPPESSHFQTAQERIAKCYAQQKIHKQPAKIVDLTGNTL